MARIINFVQSRQKKISKITEQDKKVRNVSITALGVVFTIFIVAVVLRLVAQNQLSLLQSRKERVRNAIIAQETVEKDYTLFIYKLQTITKLFDERKGKQDAITYFTQVFGPNVIVKEISYKVDDQSLAFALQARDIFTLDAVYDIFNSPDFNQKYKRVEKKGLTRDNNGSYIMDLNVTLDTEDQ